MEGCGGLTLRGLVSEALARGGRSRGLLNVGKRIHACGLRNGVFDSTFFGTKHLLTARPALGVSLFLFAWLSHRLENKKFDTYLSVGKIGTGQGYFGGSSICNRCFYFGKQFYLQFNP